jgi:hypothetical protein
MTNIDLNAQFEKISDKAKTASDKLKDAGQSTRERLETDVISARDRAGAGADRLNDKAVDAKDKAASQWQEVHAKWQAHVAKVKANVEDKQDRLDADFAADDADLAEDYALSAIDFAQATIDEAESAVSVGSTSACGRPVTGTSGGRISVKDIGAQSAKTTARTVTLGAICRPVHRRAMVTTAKGPSVKKNHVVSLRTARQPVQNGRYQDVGGVDQLGAWSATVSKQPLHGDRGDRPDDALRDDVQLRLRERAGLEGAGGEGLHGVGESFGLVCVRRVDRGADAQDFQQGDASPALVGVDRTEITL